jgi:hypothetical protein
MEALHEHLDTAARYPQQLPDEADRADLVQILFVGGFLRDILLRQQKYAALALSGLVECRDRHWALHVEIEEHIRKHRQPAQREHRHR